MTVGALGLDLVAWVLIVGPVLLFVYVAWLIIRGAGS